MLRHIVSWNFKPEIAGEEKPALAEAMKINLEALAEVVPGLLSADFITQTEPGSTHSLCLVTTHENSEAYELYAKSKEHNQVADKYVRPYTTDRVSVNYVCGR